MLKRSFDILAVIVFAAPLILICLAVALAVKLTSKGSALYWSRRMGAHGCEFEMPKFRTMRTGTPELATHLLKDAKSWLTPVGAVLRKSSLDELPQFYSVLRGDMSLVGPRPALHGTSAVSRFSGRGSPAGRRSMAAMNFRSR